MNAILYRYNLGRWRRCHRVTAVDIDHVTLRTSDLEGTRRFLENLLGLEVGYRPNFGFPGYWLYRSGRPIVHLIRGGGRGVARDAEMIDHVGFKVEGYEAFREKLDRRSSLIRRWTCRRWANGGSLFARPRALWSSSCSAANRRWCVALNSRLDTSRERPRRSMRRVPSAIHCRLTKPKEDHHGHDLGANRFVGQAVRRL